MEKIYDYKRIRKINNKSGRVFDLGNAGSFTEVTARQSIPPEECLINGIMFRSIHKIEVRNNKRIFTAYRSDQDLSILLIIWEGFPFYPHIEEGGDFMLQVLATDNAVRHIIIDNSYVRSGWMDDKTTSYINDGWLPGLLQLELKSFCHLQAESYLGGLSFIKFGELVSGNIDTIARKLDKKPFYYYPVKTSDIKPDGQIDYEVRDMAMKNALSIIKSL